MTAEKNPNVECRNSKQVRMIRNFKQTISITPSGIRFSGFEIVSDFGFRISSFAQQMVRQS